MYFPYGIFKSLVPLIDLYSLVRETSCCHCWRYLWEFSLVGKLGGSCEFICRECDRDIWVSWISVPQGAGTNLRTRIGNVGSYLLIATGDKGLNDVVWMSEGNSQPLGPFSPISTAVESLVIYISCPFWAVIYLELEANFILKSCMISLPILDFWSLFNQLVYILFRDRQGFQ